MVTILHRLPVSKLAASSVAPLQSNPGHLNNLLGRPNATWAQDVKYLRDSYTEVANLWEQLKDPSQDEQLYQQTRSHLQDLVMGLNDIAQQRSNRVDLFKATSRASSDVDVADSYARAKDFASATMYQTFALTQVHGMLESLTNEGRTAKASFLIKGYGYDTSGEAAPQSGNATNNWDTANPQNHHDTSKPAVNVARDSEAEKEFPELVEKKTQKVRFPPRLD